MSRKKPLQRPFVVTVSAVAAATLALACGGKTNGGEAGGTSTTCTPTTKRGDACGMSESLCAPEGPNVRGLKCVEGEWVTDSMWNPPRPERPCQASEPTAADSCTVAGQQCTYADRCEDRPNGAPTSRRWLCGVDGRWKRQGAYLAACPSTMPQAGSSCAACAGDYPAECTYPTSPDCPPLVTSCDPKTLTWSSVTSSCNPPPPGGDADGG